jgi:hemerythrin-like domain-containing protein
MSAQERDFADPISALRGCHRQIEAFLATLIRLADSARSATLSPGDRESLQASLRYFRETGSQHTADEEESLFPRMRQQRDRRLLPVVARIESLEEEHVCADRIHAEVDMLGDVLVRRGTLPPQEALRLFTFVVQLSDLYRHHIAVEDDEVFSTASATLPESAIQAIAGEMAFRRGMPTRG